MKTEQQPETKTNDLTKMALDVESFYRRNATALQWGVIGIAFLVACGVYYWRYNAALEASAWNELAKSNSAENFATVADTFSTTRAANWARLREANSYLETGLRDAFDNREKANTDLGKAKEILTSLKTVSGPDELRQQVLFGLARATEMTSSGDLKPAIEAYEEVIKEFPDSPFATESKRRIKQLGTKEAEEFYAFFSKQNPKPPEPPKPNDSKKSDGSLNPFAPLSPELKSLQQDIQSGDTPLPSLVPPQLPDSTEAPQKPADAGAESPATKTEAAPAATETPAAEQPAAETPAAEKPAEPAAAESAPAEQPAETKPE